MIVKPSASRVPIIVTTSQTVSTSGREIISIHYLNTTGGVGQVDITDGNSNQGITLGAAAQNGTDDWCPAQPAVFNRIVVTFTTGTGIITIQTN